MKREAEMNAESDRKARELIDERNKAEQLIYQVEKGLREAGDKVKETDKAPITAAVEKLRTATKGDDVVAIRNAYSNLEQAAHAMAQVLYGQGQQAGAGAGGASTPNTNKGDDVVDAEYEVK
jgi:molecular chaperone DnaK